MSKTTIFTDEKRNQLVDKIDDLIKLPAVVEMFDGMVMKAGLKWLDEKYGSKCPEELAKTLNQMADLFIAGQYEEIATVATPGYLNNIIDIPGLDEDLEGKMLAINIKALFEMIMFYASKHKNEPLPEEDSEESDNN